MSPTVRALLSRLSPAGRAYRRLLRSCTATPEATPEPRPLADDDVLVCGFPRSGTALLTAELFQPPRVVSVMEPWLGLQVEPRACFDQLRAQIATGTLRVGRLDVERLRTDGGVAWVRGGEQPVDVATDGRPTVACKWPGWWRWLDHLEGGRRILTLRHPAEVVASFAATGGRLADGLEYDVALHRRMNEELEREHPDPARRRVALYDRIATALLPHLERDDTFVVRYERWFDDRDGLLEELGDFLGVPLQPQVALRRPSGAPDPAIVDDVRRWCTTAEQLGYDLSGRAA